MRVAVKHTTRLDYEADVVEGVMDVRPGPYSDVHQRWDAYNLRVEPAASVWRYVDGFGSQSHLVTLAPPHSAIELSTSGEIETILRDPFALPSLRLRPLTPLESHDYLSPSERVPRLPDLDSLAAPFRPVVPDETFEAVRQLTELVNQSFAYEREITSVHSSVADILSNRAGVCQDLAHVLIGLCRSLGIAARYVSGYIVTPARQVGTARTDGSGEVPKARRTPAVRGAGASHAWIDAFTPTHGWRGFDPTNNLVASELHVKMAIGRDYADIPPTRGTFRGTATERPSVVVAATPVRP